MDRTAHPGSGAAQAGPLTPFRGAAAALLLLLTGCGDDPLVNPSAEPESPIAAGQRFYKQGTPDALLQAHAQFAHAYSLGLHSDTLYRGLALCRWRLFDVADADGTSRFPAALLATGIAYTQHVLIDQEQAQVGIPLLLKNRLDALALQTGPLLARESQPDDMDLLRLASLLAARRAQPGPAAEMVRAALGWVAGAVRVVPGDGTAPPVPPMFTLISGEGTSDAVIWLAMRVVRSHQTTDRAGDSPVLPALFAAVFAEQETARGLLTMDASGLWTAHTLLPSGSWAASERDGEGRWTRAPALDAGTGPDLATARAAAPTAVWVGDEPSAMSLRMQALQSLLVNADGVPVPYLFADLGADLTALLPGVSENALTLPARTSSGVAIDLWTAPHRSAAHYSRGSEARQALVAAFNATWRPREAELAGDPSGALAAYARALELTRSAPHPALIASAARFLTRPGTAATLRGVIAKMGEQRAEALAVWEPVLRTVAPEIAATVRAEQG